MLPPLLEEGYKSCRKGKLSDLLLLDLFNDTQGFVWSQVSLVMALRMVKLTGNVEILAMGSAFNVDQ